MSEILNISISMRMDAIRTLLRNHPVLVDMITTKDGSGLNPAAYPDELDLIEPGNTLIRIAWDLWNGGGESEMDIVLNQLPAKDFEAFIDSLKDFSKMRAKLFYAHSTGAEND